MSVLILLFTILVYSSPLSDSLSLSTLCILYGFWLWFHRHHVFLCFMEYNKLYSKMFFWFFREIIFIILKLMFFFLTQKYFYLGLCFGCFLCSILQRGEAYLDSVPTFHLSLLADVFAWGCSYACFCSYGCCLNCQGFN